MAYETGTASNHHDLLTKLLTFLTTNPALVAAGQNWQVLRDSAYPLTVSSPNIIAFTNNSSYTTVAPYSVPADWPSDAAKIKITANINAPTTGTYLFSLRHYTYAEVWIDGVFQYAATSSIVNSFATSFSLNLSAGVHQIVVHYEPSGAQFLLALGWRKPGDGAFSIVPTATYSSMSVVTGHGGYSNSLSADKQVSRDDRQVVLLGRGLSGADQIYICLTMYSYLSQDTYNISVRYATGYNATVFNGSQPGTGAVSNYFVMWDQPMKYWFIASGRVFKVIAKVSTVYSPMYAGFYLPYALPSEMPYPMVVGAGMATNVRWSIRTDDACPFWNPGAASGSANSTLLVRRPDGVQIGIRNINGVGQTGYLYPSKAAINFRTSPDNSYAFQPFTIYADGAVPGGINVYGELDGVYHITGFSNASENTLTVDGKTYMVVQGLYKTASTEYAAFLLE